MQTIAITNQLRLFHQIALCILLANALVHAGEAAPPYLNPQRAASDMAQESAILTASATRELSFTESFDLGTSLFLQGRYHEAVLAYRLASGKATVDAGRVASLLAAGQALSASNAVIKNPDVALLSAQLANQAQRIQPMNPRVAYFRVARWTEAGDQLEVQAARCMLERFNLKESGKEVLEPVTVGIIVGVAVTGIAVTYFAENKGLLTPEQRNTIILGICLAAITTVSPPTAAKMAPAMVASLTGIAP